MNALQADSKIVLVTTADFTDPNNIISLDDLDDYYDINLEENRINVIDLEFVTATDDLTGTNMEVETSNNLSNGLENITLVGVTGQTQVIEDNNFEVSSPSADYDDIPQAKKRKTMNRLKEQQKKHKGLSYKNRKGKDVPPKVFLAINGCCRMKCDETVTEEIQCEIFNSFNNLPKANQQQVLQEGIWISKKAEERKGRGKQNAASHNRTISANYTIKVEQERIKVCKKMFQTVYGVTRGQVDILVRKMKDVPSNDFVALDLRGRHTPANKMQDAQDAMLSFINQYPKYESHYTRARSSLVYLSTHLNIAKMYAEYSNVPASKGSYELFRSVFKKTGYKFKAPKADTCKTCDSFKIRLLQVKQDSEREQIKTEFDDHVKDADMAYEQKKKDKIASKNDPKKVVLVFDLEKVLDTPALTSNVAFYKRLLSTYNLTIRDCSISGGTICYMWHEGIAGRGSNDIASCLFKRINSFPPHVNHIITYSDTCGGQNRNINMAAMLSYVSSKKQPFVIDQKFLIPGHTHLECDADHAKIEKAKKKSEISIMVPSDWYQFVRTVRGEKRFIVDEMGQDSFYDFSHLLKTSLVKRTIDTEGEIINWLRIRWLQYSEEFGVIRFKYSLDESKPFRVLDIRRKVKKNRPSVSEKEYSPHLAYTRPLGINPKKKQDLLSLFELIPERCHQFYTSLKTNSRALELDIKDEELNLTAPA